MNASLYVYYKLAPSAAPALARVVKQIFAQVRAQGLCATPRLMRREGELTTWMEVYGELSDAPSLQALLESLWADDQTRAGLTPAQRHYELFVTHPLD